jgi:hypothetical protein
LDVCQRQVEEAKSFLKTTANPPFAIFCAKHILGDSELALGTVNQPSFSTQKSVETFKSFDECENNKNETLKNYAGSSIKKLLGGLCSFDRDLSKFNIILFRDIKQ